MTILERKEYKDGTNYSGSWILEYEEYDYPKDIGMVEELILEELNPKYLTPQYRDENKTNPLHGHCYHTTQAMYYFFKSANLKIMRGKCNLWGYHWWLEDEDGVRRDITSKQYYSIGLVPPYENGKEVMRWYGWKGQPHKRSLVLMNKVQPVSSLFHN